MKKFISLSLQKGGKQSNLSMNKGEEYKGVGKVTNTHNVKMRIPINTRMRVAFEGLKIHMLAVCGYLSDEVLNEFNFADGSFTEGKKGKEFLYAKKLLQNLELTYCYYHEDVVTMKGSLRLLDSSKTLVLATPKLNVDDDYEFFEFLEEECEELSSATMDWYDNRTDIDQKQMAMSFVEIDQRVGAKDAEKIFDEMDESERDEIISKHMMKFVERSENMQGKDEDPEFTEVEQKNEDEEAEEDDDFATIGGELKKEEKEGSDSKVSKGKLKNGATSKASAKKSVSKSASPKEENKATPKVEEEVDPFGEDHPENVIPQVV